MHCRQHLSIKNLDEPKLDSTQVRRKSCVCEQCGTTALKEDRLPNQLCEIAYHKQERLADVFLSKLEGARKYMRNDQKKKNFRIYARNPLFILRSQPDMEESMHLPTSPTKAQTPEKERLKTEQPQIAPYRSYKYIPTSNCFLQNMKQQVMRSNKTINRLLTDIAIKSVGYHFKFQLSIFSKYYIYIKFLSIYIQVQKSLNYLSLQCRKVVQSFQFSTSDKLPVTKSPQKNKRSFIKQLKPLPKQKLLQTKFDCMIRQFFNSSKAKQF